MAPGAQLEKTAPAMPGQPQWADRVAGGWGRARAMWARMAPSERRGAMVGGLLVAAMIGAVVWLMARPDWRTLYTGLDPDDARQIGQILAAAQITYDMTPDGTGIRVPAAMLDKARLAAAAKGGVKSGRLGFEIFDKPNWVGSEFDEQVNYQRALEGELEHTVGSLADIESARVHLVMPHDSLFRDEERPAKASVVIKLRHLSLADGEADAIRNLVASAVDGLTPDHVVLVDAAGRLPLGPKTAEAMELSQEQALEDKLVATLEPVTGVGNVRASVTLNYEDAATDTTQEVYDPNQTATLSMQRTEQNTGGEPVAAGVPGTASNAPNTQALPVYPKQTTTPQTSKSESGTYGVSKTVKHTVENPGRIRRLTAAIVVNDRMMQAAAKNKPAQWQPRTADELRNLTALAQAAVGFDQTRGDALTVQDISFDQNRAAPPPAIPQQFLSAAENSPVLVKYLALLLATFVILMLGVRPALKHVASAQLGAGRGKPRELASGETAASALPLSPVEVDPERVRSQEIFNQVTSQMKREPSQSSRLLQSWIHSD
ncbi:MAG: flagellar basal-body MS-ring/collar protein FliF [Steroidobacteraceae bacterium]